MIYLHAGLIELSQLGFYLLDYAPRCGKLFLDFQAGFELCRQVGAGAIFRQTVIKQPVNLRMTGDRLIGERHQPRAQIAYRRHIEGVTEFRRTTAGIERRHQVNGIMGVGLEPATDRVERSTATEKQQFWTQFGPVVKEGLLGPEDKKDAILDLVLTPSSTTDEATDLAGYVGRMKEGQDAIYYLTGPSIDVVEQSPLLEAFRAQGYEVLFFTDGPFDFIVDDVD